MDELWLLNVANLRQTNQTNINDRNCLKAAITDKSRSKQAAKKIGSDNPEVAQIWLNNAVQLSKPCTKSKDFYVNNAATATEKLGS